MNPEIIPQIVTHSIAYLDKFPNTTEGAYYKYLEQSIDWDIQEIKDYVNSARQQLTEWAYMINNDFDDFVLFVADRTEEQVLWVFLKITTDD